MIKIASFIYLFKYALASLWAVGMDFAIYLALTYNNFLQPGVANMISCPIGAAISWFLAGKMLFRSYHTCMRGYLIWMVYLLAVIIASSALIQTLTVQGAGNFLAKLMVVSLAFCCNSVFFKCVILCRYGRRNNTELNQQQGTK